MPLPSVPFLCVFGVFLESGNFFRGDPSVFFGEMFSRKCCLSKSDRNGKGLALKRLVVQVLWTPPKKKEIHLSLDGIPAIPLETLEFF